MLQFKTRPTAQTPTATLFPAASADAPSKSAKTKAAGDAAAAPAALSLAPAGQWLPTGDLAWSSQLPSDQPSLTEAVRRAGSRLAQALRKAGQASVHLVLAPALIERGQDLGIDEVTLAEALLEGAGIGWFDVQQFKGAASKAPTATGDLTLSTETKLTPAQRHAIQGLIGAVDIARNLAATPPNIANPAYLAKFCKEAAKDTGLSCKVIDAAQAKKLGLGGLLAVGSGGSTPPCLIELTYTPKSAKAKKQKPVLLVGKAITFDTGGYSIKSTGGLGMKYDKCGGMNVIGTMLATAALKPDVPVVGIVCCAENMIDSAAYRPDDILTFHNGVTCEVTNTDAEGRLVLADGLAYGTHTHQPQAVIDMATLTGGVGVALGSYCAGIWCHNKQLKATLDQAAANTGERLWELPLWNEHRELMKGHHADIVNSSATRECHATQGAAFLSFFVGDDAPTQLPTTPWAHIDIALTAVSEGKEGTLCPKGPTGYGVRLVTEALMHWPVQGIQ